MREWWQHWQLVRKHVVPFLCRLPGRERAATIAHELAHEILHTMRSRGEWTHRQVETEADATSYVVMRALGLPSKAPEYIAWHGGSGKLVLQSMKRVQRAARRILRAYLSTKSHKPSTSCPRICTVQP